VAALGLALAALGGCQTWLPSTGQTLPSPHYLQHPPQYFPPSPDFRHPKEQATLEAQAGAPVPGAGNLLPPPQQLPPGAR
jgi:hypothetical protein